MANTNLRALFSKRFHLPKSRPVNRAIRQFTPAERTVFYSIAVFFIFSGFVLLWRVSEAFLIEVPIQGGTLVEGVVGNPRFINPVLALSEADKNLTSLVYSGLIRITPDGKVENDLAESVELSSNNLVYTATLRKDAKFHDGEAVTADDVIFTIQKINDPGIKSPRRGNWDGVAVEKVDDQTITFTLKKAYSPFIYNLTTGILPKHIWNNVNDDEFSFSQFNTLPVGSGPYQVESVERNDGGIPDYYRLKPFKDVVGRKPYIENMEFRFYPSETALIEAYNDGVVEAVGGVSAESAAKLDGGFSHVISSPLPRIFAVFFNQANSKVLLDKDVRRALDLAAPKEAIVSDVLGGFATVIDGPIPAGLYHWSDDRSSNEPWEKRLESARQILTKSGWVLDLESNTLEKKIPGGNMSLSFSISTGDAPELRRVAESLKSAWEKLGARVEIQVYETGDLNQNVIRPRQFDALLFGEVVGRDGDVYPFWHSSQRNDPGLNIALYANARADKLLEAARATSGRDEAEKNYKAFQNEVMSDVPAVFLYSPSFLYVVPQKAKAVDLKALSTSQDRFLGVRDWYIETDKVWKIFLN